MYSVRSARLQTTDIQTLSALLLSLLEEFNLPESLVCQGLQAASEY